MNLADSVYSPWHGAGSQPAVMATRGSECWRIKTTADGASSAMEVALGKLFQLTGLLAPDSEQVGAAASLPGSEARVGSRFEARFQDLGDFLVSDAAVEAVAAADPPARHRYAALRARHAEAVDANVALLRRAGGEWWALGNADAALHAANDQRRFNALDAMNRMLPISLRSEQVRHYVAARWLDNWDHLNYRMENFGYTLRDGRRRGMTLDFGSCGPLGFRDPQSGVMLPKQLSTRVAIGQRPASLFPMPAAFAGNSAGFDTLRTDPGCLHDTRSWPYGFQSESIAAQLRPPLAADPILADTLAEMGYRLAVLPAAAIAAVTGHHWPAQVESAAQEWPSAQQMAHRLIARRDAIVARFDPAQIIDWMQADPERAARVRQEMGAALENVMGSQEARAHIPSLARGHDRLTLAGSGTAVASADMHASGVCSETRLMQQFHRALLQFDAAASGGDRQGTDNAVAALLAPSLHDPLLRHLKVGPGTRRHDAVAFDATQDWLELMQRLVNLGKADPAEVAKRLMTPVEAGAYPVEIAAWSQAHPDLGLAFVGLLEALVAQGLPAAALRAALLRAKPAGTAGYYSQLLGSTASAQWIARLDATQLWPGPDDLKQVKSWWSRTLFGVRSRLPEGQAPVIGSPGARAVQQMSLRTRIADLLQAYGPERVVALEQERMKEDILASMNLVQRDELKRLAQSVTDAVGTAWTEAAGKHGLARTRAPLALVDTQQREARHRFERDMKALRRPHADALITRAGQRYGAALQEHPAMDADARLALYTAGTREAVREIAAMVADGAHADASGPDLTAIGQQAGQAAKAVQRQVRAQAQAQAQLHALEHATRKAGAEATRQGREAAATRARRAATDQAQRNAALLAYQQASRSARQLAQTRQSEEAAARAARESEAKTERIADRLQALRNSRRGDLVDGEIAARLARLRATDRGPATAVRAAAFLDPQGRPAVAYR